MRPRHTFPKAKVILASSSLSLIDWYSLPTLKQVSGGNNNDDTSSSNNIVISSNSSCDSIFISSGSININTISSNKSSSSGSSIFSTTNTDAPEQLHHV